MIPLDIIGDPACKTATFGGCEAPFCWQFPWNPSVPGFRERTSCNINFKSRCPAVRCAGQDLGRQWIHSFIDLGWLVGLFICGSFVSWAIGRSFMGPWTGTAACASRAACQAVEPSVLNSSKGSRLLVLWILVAKKDIPSGKHTQNYGKSPFFMGKLTIPGHFQ